MRIYDRFGSREIVEAMNKVGTAKFETLEDYRKKYGFTEVTEIAVLFEEIGVFLEQNLIDIKMNTRVSLLLGESLKSNGFLANTIGGALTWSLFRGGQTSKRV